ncbi:MAG: 50S ribosomal protein L17 [Patescibacteria group bacterium]
MRHQKKIRKFGRETKQRKALMRSLAVALIEKNRITTTEAKAKSLKTYFEKLVTKGKRDGLAAFRQLTSELNYQSAVKLTKETALRFQNRRGGYVRIRKLASRISDGAKMAIIELIT